jgi:hypothetical protein
MATKINKNEEKEICQCGCQCEDLKKFFNQVVDSGKEAYKNTKEKYNNLDEDKKKKIKSGVTKGAIAVGALIILKKLFGKK